MSQIQTPLPPVVRAAGRPWRLLVAAPIALVTVVGAGWLGVANSSDAAKASMARELGFGPQPALTFTDNVAAPAVAVASGPDKIDVDAVKRAVTPLLAAPGLGSSVGVYVGALSGGDIINQGGPVMPASVLKVLTTTAALEAVGGQTRFSTIVRREPGTDAVPRIVLVGGGDPLLSATAPTNPDEYPTRATLTDLAASTAQALSNQGVHQVGLDFDATLFSGPATGQGWLGPDVASGIVAPISALSVDEGLGTHRSADPAAGAAAAFAEQLQGHGIAVAGPPRAAVSPAGATDLAQVQSAPLAQIVERTLERSDNFAAEVIARHVGLKAGGAGSFDGATKGIRSVLQRLGIHLDGAVLLDGSGLSRNDRVSASTVAQVLRVGVSHPQLNGAFTGLPIAGFTGTLVGRFDQAKAALGLVHAKTGTLSNDHGLAGIVPDANGTPFVFVVIADAVGPSDGLAARNELDQIAAAIAACTCSHPPSHTS